MRCAGSVGICAATAAAACIGITVNAREDAARSFPFSGLDADFSFWIVTVGSYTVEPNGAAERQALAARRVSPERSRATLGGTTRAFAGAAR